MCPTPACAESESKQTPFVSTGYLWDSRTLQTSNWSTLYNIQQLLRNGYEGEEIWSNYTWFNPSFIQSTGYLWDSRNCQSPNWSLHRSMDSEEEEIWSNNIWSNPSFIQSNYLDVYVTLYGYEEKICVEQESRIQPNISGQLKIISFEHVFALMSILPLLQNISYPEDQVQEETAPLGHSPCPEEVISIYRRSQASLG